MSSPTGEPTNVVQLPGVATTTRKAGKRPARKPSRPRPPINGMCISNCPEDVLYQAQQVVRFLQLTQRLDDNDGEPAMRAYREGQDVILGLLGDALAHASAMCSQQRQ